MTTAKPTLPAVSVAMRRQDRMLLVKRGRAPSRGLYAFPGGRVEAGETLEAAARRELFEETRLEAGELSPFLMIHVEGEVANYDLQVFLTSYVGGEAVAGDDAESAGFFTLEDMQTLPVTESVFHSAREILAGVAAGGGGTETGSGM
jgi:8-oxo-dGTP diphosphatase